MQHKLRALALEPDVRTLILEALADAEKICDWAHSCDTSRKDWTGTAITREGTIDNHFIPGAETKLFDRMSKLFDELEGRL